MDSYDSLENYPRRLMKKATLAFSLLQPRDVPLFFTRDQSQVEWRLERRCCSCRFSHVRCDQFLFGFFRGLVGFRSRCSCPYLVGKCSVFAVRAVASSVSC